MEAQGFLIMLFGLLNNPDTNFQASFQGFVLLVFLAMVLLVQFWWLYAKTKRAYQRYKQEMIHKQTLFSDLTMQLMDPMAMIFGILKNVEQTYKDQQPGALGLLKKNFQDILDQAYNLHVVSQLDEQVGEPIYTFGDMRVVMQQYMLDHHVYAREQGKDLVLKTTFQSCAMDFEADLFEKIFYQYLHLLIYTSRSPLIEMEASIVSGEQATGFQKWLEPGKQYLLVQRKISGEVDNPGVFSQLEDMGRMLLQSRSNRKVEYLSLYMINYLMDKIGGLVLYNADSSGLSSVVLFFPIPRHAQVNGKSYQENHRDFPDRDKDILLFQKNILVIDQDTAHLSHLQGLLEPGFLVNATNRVDLDSDQLLRYDPGLVLIGSTDGKDVAIFNFCRILRSQDRFKDIPVLQLLDHHDPEYKIQALKSGVTSFLVKPITREELALQIGKLVTGPAIPIVERQSPKQTAKNMALNEAFMDRIREVVENNISNTDFRVEDLCKALHMSHSKLHRKTVTASGMTPQQVIRQMRLDYATEQLNNPELNINEIALQAGFEDPGYFTRVFKREKGLTPTEWREEYGSSDKGFY